MIGAKAYSTFDYQLSDSDFATGEIEAHLQVDPDSSDIYEVVIEMRAYATGQIWNTEGRGGYATAECWVDPYIYIDPSWPYADQYEIVVSEGIGNSPIPEPSALSLCGMGFASLLAVALLRRNRKR